MIAEKLRQAILQAAIQGKLTKQLKSDGDASKLLTAIQVKRTEFIKKGKIKKETVLPKIAEAEKLFEIPNNWCWARFGEIVINRDAEC
jgi:type I restriction enzyme S subunit